MTIDLDALRVFVKVAELASFTQAAEQLGLAKARVSLQVKELEESLGAKLLQRSTRVVRLTTEGEQLCARAHRLLTEAEEVGSMFQSARAIRGRVRADFPVTLARALIIPKLPELLSRHPGLELTLSATDRRVDAMREGFDCVLRVGAHDDPNLVGRRLGSLRMMNCASPGYLATHGTPRTVEELSDHSVIHYASTLGGDPPSFEYPTATGYAEVPMKSRLTVNSVDAYHAAAMAGLGIIQTPRAGMHARLAEGSLVEILQDLPSQPMPVCLLHTHGRSVPKGVKAVMHWIAEVMAPFIEAEAGAVGSGLRGTR